MGAGDRRVHRGPARVVLNATASFPGGSGVQTYAAELVAALGPLVHPDALAVDVLVDRALVDTVPASMAARGVRADSGVWRKLQSARSWPVDVVHGLDVDIPWRARGARRVATIHDLAQLDTPWAFGRSGALKRRLTRYAARHADVLVAVSTFTAERIAAHFGRDAVVIPEAPRTGCAPATPEAIAALRARLGLPERFVGYLGNLEPRKDVAVLAAACAAADVPLVIAGGAVATVTTPPGAHRVGYLPDGDVAAFYGAATVVAYVSRYEGFGLPPVEALACGAAVMATPVGALPDVAPDGIAYVPVGDADAQAAVLRELLGDVDRRTELAATGRSEVARLSWARTAAATIDAWGVGG